MMQLGPSLVSFNASLLHLIAQSSAVQTLFLYYFGGDVLGLFTRRCA